MNIKIKKTMIVNDREYQCGDYINIKVQGEWYHGEIVANRWSTNPLGFVF